MKKMFFTLATGLFLSLSSMAQFVQSPLPYDYKALEPSIDAKTMEIHYSKHHAAYVKNLNLSLEAEGKGKQTDLLAIIKNISAYTAAVRNNAGGHFNHDLFWKVLTPKKDTKPSEELNEAITVSFGSIEELKAIISKQAGSVFGSGWAWLIVTPDKKLMVTTSSNQDNPIMDIAPVKGTPIFCIDVWEHAYYLNYQNRRADYIQNIWNVVNWEVISENYAKAIK